MGCHIRLYSFLLSVMPLLLFPDLHFVVSANQPQISPTTSPESLSSNSPSPFPKSGVPAPGPSTNFNSPPSPLLSDQIPTPITGAPSPSNDAKDLNHGSKGTANSEASLGAGGGLKGGQKAGIVIGVIIIAFIVGMVGIIYKKRQDNLRRAHYSYTARREFL